MGESSSATEAAGREGRFSIIVYFAVWLFGVVGGTLFFFPTLKSFSSQLYRSLNSTGIPLSEMDVFYFLVAILIATFAHISLVYISMHEMDARPADWRNEFPNWANSRFEYLVRVFIMLALLSIADKIWPVLEKLTSVFGAGYDPSAQCAHGRANLICIVEPLYVFPASCAALFMVLLLWDVLGVWRKDLHTNANVFGDIVRLVFRMSSDPRAAFFRSDLFGFLFWTFMAWFRYVDGVGVPMWILIVFLFISPFWYIVINAWRVFRFVAFDGLRIVVARDALPSSQQP